MAITTSLQALVEHPHFGGSSVTVKIAWGGATPYARDTLYRLNLVALDGGSYAHVEYCYSGIPGGVNPFDILALPQSNPEHIAYLTVLHAFTPRLHPGIYYIRPEYWNGGAWVTFGTSSPMQIKVLPAYRPRDIYDIRQLWPIPPYVPGARNLDEEPMVML